MAADEVFADPDVLDLVEAAAAGDERRVRSLVHAGVDPNARGSQGATPLMYVCVNGRADGVGALLAAGADPALTDEAGRTALHVAAAAEGPDALDVLLAHGVDPDCGDASGWQTPLAAALRAGREPQFRRLLAAGADPHAVDRFGNTLLHVGGKVNATRCVLALLDAGVDPSARNRQGLTFRDYLDMTPIALLTDEASEDVTAVDAWLDEHGVTLGLPSASDAASQHRDER